MEVNRCTVLWEAPDYVVPPDCSTGDAVLKIDHALKLFHELGLDTGCLIYFLGDSSALWVAHSSGPHTSSVFEAGVRLSCSHCHNISTVLT